MDNEAKLKHRLARYCLLGSSYPCSALCWVRPLAKCWSEWNWGKHFSTDVSSEREKWWWRELQIKRRSGRLKNVSELRIREGTVALNTFKEGSLFAGGAGGLLLAVFANGRVFPYTIRICIIIVSIQDHPYLAPLTYLHGPVAPQYTPSCPSFACSRP